MFRAGAASRDITPSEPMFLGGYSPTRRWTTVHDALSARAVALSDGSTTVVLIAVDSIGFLRDLADRVRAAVQALTGVARDRVFVAATHSHSTPDTLGLYGGAPETYRARLVVQSAGAAVAAVNRLRPARMRWVQGEVNGVSMNRRLPPGALDRQCTVLQWSDTGGRTIATLTNFAAHPVCLGPDNQAVTADFVHFLRARLERECGGVALYTNGAEGNVNPSPQLHPADRLDRTGGTFAMAERMGSALADAVLEALAAPDWRADMAIESRVGTCHVPVENEAFRQAIAAGLVPRTLTDGATDAPLGLVRLGDVRLVMLPGEAFAEIGLRIKQWWSGEPVAVVGLCNDHVGYLLPPELFAAGDYEESVSASPEAWPSLARALRRLGGLAQDAA